MILFEVSFIADGRFCIIIICKYLLIFYLFMYILNSVLKMVFHFVGSDISKRCCRSSFFVLFHFLSISIFLFSHFLIFPYSFLTFLFYLYIITPDNYQ